MQTYREDNGTLGRVGADAGLDRANVVFVGALVVRAVDVFVVNVNGLVVPVVPVADFVTVVVVVVFLTVEATPLVNGFLAAVVVVVVVVFFSIGALDESVREAGTLGAATFGAPGFVGDPVDVRAVVVAVLAVVFNGTVADFLVAKPVPAVVRPLTSGFLVSFAFGAFGCDADLTASTVAAAAATAVTAATLAAATISTLSSSTLG